ncbi:MAG: signal peptidase I [Oscillospiraceae bacterium]|nr:signal peptidase I [Oscillospiraceae bacterium]
MNHKTKENKSFDFHRKISFLVTVLLVLSVALCLYAAVQVVSNGYVNIGGFMMFRVVTGSMEPTVPIGSLLITKEVEIENIALNDIVCFRTRVEEIWGKVVTHRVVGIMETETGILLETKGDANPVMDGYYVDGTNLIGKVIWHTGDGSMLADALSLFTSKIGFLGFIVMPSLILAGLILKSTVGSIHHELQMMMEMERQQQIMEKPKEDPLCGISEEEYREMYERIRKELMEELMQSDEIQPGEDKRPEESDNK